MKWLMMMTMGDLPFISLCSWDVFPCLNILGREPYSSVYYYNNSFDKHTKNLACHGFGFHVSDGDNTAFHTTLYNDIYATS